MKTAIQSILVAALLVTLSGPAAAAPEADNGATSVSEMMQRKHEHQMRAQLVAEGRWDQVRQMDEESAERLREKSDDRYTRTNEALGHAGKVRGADDVQIINECAPEKLHL